MSFIRTQVIFAKKAILLLPFIALVASCKSNSSDKKTGGTDSSASVKQTAKARNSEADTSAMKIGTEPTGGGAGSNIGKDLIAKADCNTCHKLDTKLIGPAFQDIAAKYPASEANIEMLSKKIITGGKGNWGDIAMTPHPSLSESDAKEMAKYVLSLKK
ncbi:c-type cytochrome [Mucilaginibacter sp. RCC_168]|uniref:c-type cytochrome n=1 Tax=Mucilaginibacter sp. RCC_168 TaxID=3239221 RepID=UPI0035243C55